MKKYILRRKFEGDYWNAEKGEWTPFISEAYKFNHMEMVGLWPNIHKKSEEFVEYPN